MKSRKQTEKLFSEGKRFTVGFFRVYYLERINDEGGLLFGVGVPARTFKKAVDRNRVKRQVREAYRLQKEYLQKQLSEMNLGINVFFIYTGKDLPDFKEVYSVINRALEKLGKIIYKN